MELSDTAQTTDLISPAGFSKEALANLINFMRASLTNTKISDLIPEISRPLHHRHLSAPPVTNEVRINRTSWEDYVVKGQSLLIGVVLLGCLYLHLRILVFQYFSKS